MADRSTLRDTQYRPVSTAETSADDGLSVRAVRDLALDINNTFARACAPVVCDCWPGQQFWDAHADTDEHVVWRMPAWWTGTGVNGWGMHYNKLSWGIVAYIGAASANATYRLYSSEHYYRGPETITSDLKETLGRYSSDSIVASTAIGGCDVTSNKDALYLHPNDSGHTYLMMSVAFANTDGTNLATLLSFSATLSRKVTDVQT